MTNNTSDDPVGSINISADKPLETADPEYTIEPKENNAERRILNNGSSSRWKWLLPLSFLLFLFYLAAGYLVVPLLCRATLSNKLGVYLNRPVTVGGASFNPLTLNLTLRNSIIGPRLSDPDDPVDPVLSFSELEANIDISSLFKRKLVCSHFTINQLFFHLVRNRDDTYNLVEMISDVKKNSERSTVPFGFALQNIKIEDSRILFSDRPTEKTHTIEKISLALPALATPDGDGTESPFLLSAKQSIMPRFSAIINGSPVNFTGETNTTTDAIEARFHLILNSIDLPQYLSYLPGVDNFTISKGQADLDLNLVMSQPADGGLEMRIEGSGQFADVWIQDSGGRTSRFPQTTISGSFAPFKGRYRFQQIECQSPEIHLTREKNGSFLFPGLPFPKKNNGARSGLHIDHLIFKNGKLSFIDHCVKGGFTETVDGIDMQLDFSEDKEEGTFSISGRTKDGATISSQGQLSFSPLKIAGRLDMENLPLPPYSVYLASHLPLPHKKGPADKIKLSQVKPLHASRLIPAITSGTLTAKGAFQFPEYSFNGFAKIKNFAANDNSGRKLLRWRLANSENIQLRLEPFSLKTPLINIDRGFLNWTRSADEPNFTARLIHSFPKNGNHINIEKIRVSNITISFHDRTISPHFAINFILSGTMTDLVSQTDGKTKFSFQCLTDDKAPCNFDGETSFFADRDVTLHAEIKAQPVVPFIPYLEKLFSYGIQGGIFDLDAVYRQENGKMKMDSKIVVTGFKVGRPLRKNANLDLTRALLQDTAGQIHLRLAGSGDADELSGPYSLLSRGLQNLRLKTAVSPFSLLPSLEEGAETPADHLLFPFGQAGLTKKAEKQLIDLASILKKRPELTIKIKGFADDASDGQVLLAGLQKENFQKKMMRERRSLEKAARTYGQEEIHLAAKPSADAQVEKPISVTKNDLLELALLRATHVHDYLLRKLKINPHCIILDDIGLVVPGYSTGRPGSRVDFILSTKNKQ
ncbi:MAG: DUF748 domain-containing protein [Desulfobulbaceae bacterium]|nr:DUF748 domain-containing protein [Desulfobulbaceae bacterium]